MPEEAKGLNQDKLAELRFIQYISLLADSGMQQLGKVMNPVTGKTEKNLESAKAIIELLSMLKEKTKGNLTENEEKFLSGVVDNLQLNYADEVNRQEQGKSGKS